MSAASLWTATFLAALAAAVLLQIWLGLRQIAHVGAHRAQVPEAFRDAITAEAHAKAAAYTIAKTWLHLVSLAAGALLVLGWTLGGGLALVDRAWEGWIVSPLLRGVAVVMSVLFLMAALDLPFALYRTFVLEERFGFNRTTPALFLADLAKSAALGLSIGGPLLLLILWIMAAAGRWWWLYAWAVWVGFSVLQAWAYPRLIAPLFNRFSPLADDALAARVRRLAEATGFTVSGIFVMDGSRRSAHGNAYMTGLGAAKRIVFFDTLLKALAPDEAEAVLAHEIGHYKRRHVQKVLLVGAIAALAGWALLGWLKEQPWFYHGLGVAAPSDHMALLLFLIVAPVFTLFARPLLAALSRRFEFEADDFAAAFADPRALAAGLVKLYRDNANTLTPDPLYSAFYHTHPPPAARIRHLQARAA